jgi:dipeptidyl aminopeptidase/acylaminoacyl peptidase
VALHDELRHFQIITVATGKAVSVLPNQEVVEQSLWSPDGQRLAYIDAYYSTSLEGFTQSYLSIVNADGSDNHSSGYYRDSSDQTIVISRLTWNSTGEMLAALAIPYKCKDFNGLCDSIIILVDRSNEQLYELYREYDIHGFIDWSPNDEWLTFGCFSLKTERSGRCVANFLVR